MNIKHLIRPSPLRYAAQFQEANTRKVRLGGRKELEKPLISELRQMWLEQGLVA